MGSSTQHLDLYKPDRTDYVSVITDLNNNLDKIDDFAGDVSEKFSGDALNVANGGTGATTAAAARTNLGITPGNIGAVPATGGTFTGTVRFSKSTDASGTQYNSPALVIGGNPDGAHIEIDNNEIIAKANETTGANLSLNFDGGGSVNLAAGSLIVHPTDGVTLKKALSIANGGTGQSSEAGLLNYLIGKFVVSADSSTSYWLNGILSDKSHQYLVIGVIGSGGNGFVEFLYHNGTNWVSWTLGSYDYNGENINITNQKSGNNIRYKIETSSTEKYADITKAIRIK